MLILGGQELIKKQSKLDKAQMKVKRKSEQTNEKIEELGGKTSEIHLKLVNLQSIFDEIRGIPTKEKLQLATLKKVRLNWESQVEKIETDYKMAEAKAGGFGAAGMSAGIAVASFGPTVAMGAATTFGVASTGTAISTLSGAAQINAALAWIGGGALTAGGTGMAGGQLLLGLAGPIGWAIAGVTLLGSGFLFFSAIDDKNRLERIFISVSERDTTSYKLAIVELEERIKRIDNETKLLDAAIIESQSFGTNYDVMSEQQQYELITFVNLMNSSTQLLVNPILGLQPKFTNDDLEQYYNQIHQDKLNHKTANMMVALGNLLYKINLAPADKKVLFKSLSSNKKFIESTGFTKKEFTTDIMNEVFASLDFKYNH